MKGQEFARKVRRQDNVSSRTEFGAVLKMGDVALK